MSTMKVFSSITFAWWQVGLLKLSMLSLGLALGSAWPDVFAGWQATLLVIFVVPAFYVSYVWLNSFD
jgi:hypothetical protein